MTYLFNANTNVINEVEIKNDANGAIRVNVANGSGNVTTTNPFPVTGNITVGSIGNLPSATLTAFEEPLAVGITPIIQGDMIYGMDSDFWNTTKLSGGNVALTANSTWEVSSGTSAGGYARLSTARYVSYRPGQGAMFRWTAAFTTTADANTNNKNAFGIDNIVQNTGPIGREDGYSVGYSGSTANNASRKIGFLHRRAGVAETRTLTINTAPTGTQTATITLNGTAFTVGLTSSSNTPYTAAQIAANLKANSVASNQWDIDSCANTLTFTYYSPGPKSGTYSFSSTGAGTLAAASFSQTAAGRAPVDDWTYVDNWDNQSVSFDPTKLNVFGVDFRWLGAGIVRFFMEDPATGKMTLMHTQRWASTNTVPHLVTPSLRLTYRSGTTSGATPSQNVIVTGASVFGAIQGTVTQTGSSQSYYDINTSSRAKDTVWHLLSIQNPFIRNNLANKSSLIVQDISVSAQGSDPCIIYLIKNVVGTSDHLVFNPLPAADPFYFAQYSTSAVSTNLALDRLSLVQSLAVNGTAQFNLLEYNLSLAPGDYLSAFISSSSPISRTSIGMTWLVD